MKRRILCVILTAAMVAMLSACGSDDTSEKDEGKIVSVEVNDEPGENTDISGTSSSENDISSEEENSNETLDEKSLQAYQDFLDGNAQIYFDKDYPVLSDPYTQGLENGIFTSTDHYDLQGFKDAICKGESLYWGQDYDPKTIKYAYIDCGNDGISELAITFSDTGILYNAYTDIFVIKNINDKLELCYWQQYGERTELSINQYGYISYGGSGGASTDSYTYYYINKDGDVNRVYQWCEDYYIGGIVCPNYSDTDFDTLSKELGISDTMMYEWYDLRDLDDDYYYSDYDISEDSLQKMYIYYKTQDYEKVEDDSIYDESSPYKKLWDLTSLPLYTQEEIGEALWEREAELGVTESILNGETVSEWNTLQ